MAGLLVREGNWLSAPWDTLVTDVALSQVARQRVLAGISRGWEAGLKMVGFFSTNIVNQQAGGRARQAC